jgi:hypothetical protein
MKNQQEEIADAIEVAATHHYEAAHDIAKALREGLIAVARSITPKGLPGTDANGGSVDSLTESCMGITGGLCRVATAIDNLADAIADRDV